MMANNIRKLAARGIWGPAAMREVLLGCMRSRRVVTLLAMVLFGLLAWFVLARPEAEPVYNGRDLSHWLTLLEPESNGASISGGSKEAAEAIRRMGTNTLPWLLNWIQYEVRPMWGPFDLGRTEKFARATRAKSAFKILGSNASPAVAELTAIMNDPRADWGMQRAIVALAYIGEDGLPPLVGALSNTNFPRHLITASLRDMVDAGVDTHTAVPALLLCLKDADGTMQQAAEEVLEKLADKPEKLAQSLTNCLSSTDVRIRLASLEFMNLMKTQFRTFRPAIQRALDDPDLAVRTAATNALGKIDPR